jgi:hypoxanthine phosphoribosyltransferase
VDVVHVDSEIESVLFTEERILARIAELARDLERDYEGRDLVLVGVLGGAAMATVDLARALDRHVEIGWMAVRSYGSGTRSSGSVRLLKDLDVDITDRHVVIVDGVIDTGLTATWLVANLSQRRPASVAVCGLFRKPAGRRLDEITTYIGFEVGPGMLVGYGLDYAGRYRNLRCCAILSPQVYEAVTTAR